MITRSEARNRFGLDDKQLKRLELAREIRSEKSGSRWYVDERDIQRYLATRAQRRDFLTQAISRDDYFKCLNFGIESYYQYQQRGSTSNFGTATRRDAGKFVFDFTQGKLGEIGLRNFLQKRFDVDIVLDFDIKDEVVGQDVSAIIRPRVHGMRVEQIPKLGLSIKSTKSDNLYLAVGQNEVEDPLRYSDVYVLMLVNLPQDYLLRHLRDLKEIKTSAIPDIEMPVVEAAGFVYRTDFSLAHPTQKLPNGTEFMKPNYVQPLGLLHRCPEDWTGLVERL